MSDRAFDVIERHTHQYDRKISYEPRSDGRVEKTEYEWSSAGRWRFVWLDGSRRCGGRDR